MNVFEYAATCEKQFEQAMQNMSGYKRQTTFYMDLSIAECFGLKSIQQTYDSVMKEWLTNVVYMTEFVLSLNHKIWQHHTYNAELAKLYDDLWSKAHGTCLEYYKGKDLNYYLETVD
jgi:hypothetical protein